MSTPFYEIYRCLCQRAGKSDNAAAAEIGLSNSTITTWRQGAVPRRPTLKKVAAYFGVTEDFLMGYTIDAQIMVVESKLRHLRAAYDFSEESEQAAILQEIEALEKTYSELCARKNRQEKTPALSRRDERDIEKRLAEILSDLESDQEGLMFSGDAMDDTTRELLATSLRNSMEIGKKLAKQKFTPKKYRKED
ncbi:helix-turn-helix transcriptional regulator [uncultured Dysosmobacter sp.]|uniref:helix-turn-helix domain-containing protein n=1 Tax=uncultured Dysosmobacter sp. TaxID=2591384 RepID=UPI00261164EF|nr:helix-turn-helix transcriptional regulator [uncultured Dysosmobacter sp.]